jgi:hypothetical protein
MKVVGRDITIIVGEAQDLTLSGRYPNVPSETQSFPLSAEDASWDKRTAGKLGHGQQRIVVRSAVDQNYFDAKLR